MAPRKVTTACALAFLLLCQDGAQRIGPMDAMRVREASNPGPLGGIADRAAVLSGNDTACGDCWGNNGEPACIAISGNDAMGIDNPDFDPCWDDNMDDVWGGELSMDLMATPISWKGRMTIIRFGIASRTILGTTDLQTFGRAAALTR